METSNQQIRVKTISLTASQRAKLEDATQETPLRELVGEFTKLKKPFLTRHRLVGICPLHEERTPSFCVDTQKNRFYCLGCSWGGGPRQFADTVLLAGQQSA